MTPEEITALQTELEQLKNTNTELTKKNETLTTENTTLKSITDNLNNNSTVQEKPRTMADINKRLDELKKLGV